MSVFASRLPDHQPFVYELAVDGEPVAWFRYDDGWRFLHDGPGSTVDRETLINAEQARGIALEAGLVSGADLFELLHRARAS